MKIRKQRKCVNLNSVPKVSLIQIVYLYSYLLSYLNILTLPGHRPTGPNTTGQAWCIETGV